MGDIKIKVKGIVKDHGRYLIVERWYDDRIVDPYRWEFVDGPTKSREDPAKAVIRIIKEQTGMDAVMDRVLYTWTYELGETFCIGICYECFALTTKVTLSEDIIKYEWVKKEEFKRYIDNEAMLHDLENSNFSEK